MGKPPLKYFMEILLLFNICGHLGAYAMHTIKEDKVTNLLPKGRNVFSSVIPMGEKGGKCLIWK